MIKADCPSCGAKVNVGPKPKMGLRLVCGSCRTELEIAWLDPVELDFPFDEDDDDEYDESDEADFEEESY